MPLSRRGTVWSYTDARYTPPAAVRRGGPVRPLLHRGGGARRGEDGGDGPGGARGHGGRPVGGHRGRAGRGRALRGRRPPVPGVEMAAGRPDRGVRVPDDRDVAVLGRGHAPLGQVGPQLRRVRAGRGARRPGATPGCRGPTSSSSRVPTPSATATRASSPAPPSPRPWAGRAPACRAPTRRARRAPPPSPRHAPRSWPGCATSRSWSGPTPPPRGSSPRSGANGKTTPTGCDSICSAPPTPPTSPSMPAAAWSSSAPPRTTSPP